MCGQASAKNLSFAASAAFRVAAFQILDIYDCLFAAIAEAAPFRALLISNDKEIVEPLTGDVDERWHYRSMAYIAGDCNV